MILAAPSTIVVGGLMRAGPLVTLGTYSYSIYLVHWPIYVLSLSVFGDATGGGKLWIILAIAVTSFLLFRLIEERFRYAAKVINIFAGCGLLILGLKLAPLVYANGYVSQDRLSSSNSEIRSAERLKFCNYTTDLWAKKFFRCVNDRGSEELILLWGDSHAEHLLAGFSAAFPSANIAVASRTGCVHQSGFGGYRRDFGSELRSKQCEQHNRSVLRWLLKEVPGENVLVVLSSAKRGRPEVMAQINNKLVNSLSIVGHTPLIISDFVRPGTDLRACVARPNIFFSDEIIRNVCQPDWKQVFAELAYNKQLLAVSHDIIDTTPFQCPNGECSFFLSNGRVTHRDEHHLSTEGSVELVGRLLPSILKEYKWTESRVD